MRNHNHYIYPDVNALAAAFVCEFIKFLNDSGKFHRPLNVALSGGATPLLIFKQLRDTTRRSDWRKIRLFWGDERCVSPDHKESNYGNAWRYLIDPLNLPEEQLFRIMGEMDPVKEAQRYSDLMMDHLPLENGIPVFDWIWLGLGVDGHTASIFPDQMVLWHEKAPYAVATHPHTGQQRITLTGHVINAARRVSFLVSGSNKAGVVREIIMKKGDYLNYPAASADQDAQYLEWYLDHEAASKL